MDFECLAEKLDFSTEVMKNNWKHYIKINPEIYTKKSEKGKLQERETNYTIITMDCGRRHKELK